MCKKYKLTNIQFKTINLLINKGNVIKRTMDSYMSSVQLQAMTNNGPLNVLSEIEFNCWMRLSILRSISIASYELNKLLKEKKLNNKIKFQVYFMYKG